MVRAALGRVCLLESMGRVVTYLLAVAALLVQLRLGALPEYQGWISLGNGKAACCCGGGLNRKAMRPCCQKSGCEQCVRVPAPERQAAVVAKPKVTERTAAVVTAAALPMMSWSMEPGRDAWSVPVRVDCSPPGIGRLMTTHLLL